MNDKQKMFEMFKMEDDQKIQNGRQPKNQNKRKPKKSK